MCLSSHHMSKIAGRKMYQGSWEAKIHSQGRGKVARWPVGMFSLAPLKHLKTVLHVQNTYIYICQTFLFTHINAWLVAKHKVASSRWRNWPRCVGSVLLIWVKAYVKGPYWWVTEPSMPWLHRLHPSPHWQACWCIQHDSKATLLLLCVMSPKDTSKHWGAACLRKPAELGQQMVTHTMYAYFTVFTDRPPNDLRNPLPP